MRTLLRLSLLLLPPALLPAQTWLEAGDAGDLRPSAQVPVGAGPLTAIQGTLPSFGDVDLFLIQVDNPATFAATTVGGANVDTQLFLFDQNGRGVTHCDDSAGGLQSTLTSMYVPAPGRYYLAISLFDNDPACSDGFVWGMHFASEIPPNGARAGEVFDRWLASAGVNPGPYTIFLTGASFAGKQLVLPDNHHLSENASQLGAAGSSNWWRSGGGRFQVLYHGDHFTSAGVNGPITIGRILFRGEDGEQNLGGVTWTNATVRLASTSLTRGTMTSTFATNLAPGTTTLGTSVNGPVTMRRSLGSTPNSYNIVIDFGPMGGLQFDPTSAQPNLLVDVQLPNAATLPPGTTSVMAMQDATGDAAFVRGYGVHAGTSAAATGTLADPPVLGIEFSGNGGSRVVVPARNESYGAGCGGSPSSFYQAFVNGQGFDLQSVVLTPNDVATPTHYTVARHTNPVELSVVGLTPDSTADEGLVTQPLGFTFRFPGGSTTSIAASTNGFVWLDAAAGGVNDWTPSIPELLDSVSPRLAPFWCDLNCGRNLATHWLSGLFVDVDTSGGAGNAVCYVTWREVALHNTVATSATSVITVQLVLKQATGEVEFRYGATPRYIASSTQTGPHHPLLVGFSRGRIGAVPSADPRSRDLSLEVPFTTSAEGGVANLGLTSYGAVAGGEEYGARAFGGQTIGWAAIGVPPGAVIGALLLDLAPTRPGFTLPTITAPGCILSTSLSAVVHDLHVAPNATQSTLGFPVPPGFDGAELYAQYVVLDGLFGGSNLITVASNALVHTVGRR